MLAILNVVFWQRLSKIRFVTVKFDPNPRARFGSLTDFNPIRQSDRELRRLERSNTRQ
jgi:hypothetical protein